MKTITFDIVRQQYESWRNAYDSNNHTGKECILFANMGEQWEEFIANDRLVKNKESLTLNYAKRHLTRLKSQAREIEFSSNLSPTTKEWENNIEETNAFRLLIYDAVLSNDMLEMYADGFDKCADYGYAVAMCGYGPDGIKTLSNVPCFVNLKDPSIAFFDKSAVRPTKIDGRFCGLRYMVSHDEFVEKYPKYKNASWIKENNEIIDYFYRDYELKEFHLLKGGEYKREDRLTDEDRDNFELNEKGEAICRKAAVSCIYFMRFCNMEEIEGKTRYPLENYLPMVYHFGLTEWYPGGDRTFPFIYMIRDAQRLHNYVQSQIATMAKNSSSDKWVFYKDHARTVEAQQALSNINQNEGAFFIDKSEKDYIRERPSEIPQTMIVLANDSKTEINEIAGSVVDGMENTPKVISGVAMDKIAHNINLLQTHLFSCHIRWINDVSLVMREMYPLICTEERTLVVKKQDGGAQAITINKLLDTGKILNNIKDIDDNFHYEIIAGPSSTMQKENTKNALREAYSIDQSGNILKSTVDIYMRMLDTPYSTELSRRMIPQIDPMLIKFSQGEVSQEDFMQYQQQQKQQAMQMAQADPQAQSMVQIGQAEVSKAKTAQFNAETKRSESIAKTMDAQSRLQLDLAKLMQEKENADRDRNIQILKEQIKRNDFMIKEMVNAAKERTAQAY